MKSHCTHFLNYVEQNAKELQQASNHYKKMENRVYVAMFFADAIENCTYGVGNTAAQKQDKSGQGNGGNCHLCGKDDAPTHTDITDHREFGIFFEINCGQGDCHCGKSPNDSKNHPSPNGGNRTNGR